MANVKAESVGDPNASANANETAIWVNQPLRRVIASRQESPASTLNLKVEGSNPSRPIKNCVQIALFGLAEWAKNGARSTSGC
jgi:hypothetical protein